jgi:hypothetical protein
VRTNDLFGVTDFLSDISDADIQVCNGNGEIDANTFVAQTAMCKVHLTIPGTPFNHTSLYKVYEFLLQLYRDYGFRCTRTDAKVRDHSKLVDVPHIYRIAQAGDYSGANSHSFYSTRHRRDTNNGEQQNDSIQSECSSSQGDTVYFGSPSSDKRVTFYNALPVHGIDALDIEVRFRKSKAQNCLTSLLFSDFEALAARPFEDFVRNIHRVVAGSIDFIRRDGSKDISRLSRYDFWESFRNASDGTLRVRRDRRDVSARKIIDWVGRQVAPSLAIIHKLIGVLAFRSWMARLLEQGERRLTDMQTSFIKACMQSKQDLIAHINAT